MGRTGPAALARHAPQFGEGSCSVLVIFRSRLHIAYGPGAVTGLPRHSFNLPKKPCREGDFTPEALIARVASQAHVHVTHSRFKSSPENAQLLLVQFKQHVRRASRSR